MTIRNKLSLQITLIVAALILFAFLIVLYFSALYRKSEFYSRLEEKALYTARLLLEVEEIDSTLLTKINHPNSTTLIGESSVIFSYSGDVLYSTDNDNSLKIGREELDKVKEESLQYERGEIEVIGLSYNSNGKSYYIFTGAYDKYGKRKIVNLQFTLLFTWIFCIFVMAYAGWLYSGRALKPVSKIIREVDQISEKNIQVRIDTGNGKDELARLAQTFNNMLDRIENSIKLEKTFLANASHELRNPLTAITSQLEVCLLSERSPAEYSVTVKSVLDDIKSLNLLCHQLLLLTRMETGYTDQRFHKERIDQLIFDAAENSSKSIENLQVDYRFLQDIQRDEEWELICVRELIISVFQNIIENAAKFGARSLIIQHEYQSGFHKITFTDDGIGIHSKDLAQVFKPFFRSENSTESEGHGIGLSLVKRVVDLHKGEVKLTSARGKGTSLIIRLPENPEHYAAMRSLAMPLQGGGALEY